MTSNDIDTDDYDLTSYPHSFEGTRFPSIQVLLRHNALGNTISSHFGGHIEGSPGVGWEVGGTVGVHLQPLATLPASRGVHFQPQGRRFWGVDPLVDSLLCLPVMWDAFPEQLQDNTTQQRFFFRDSLQHTAKQPWAIFQEEEREGGWEVMSHISCSMCHYQIPSHPIIHSTLVCNHAPSSATENAHSAIHTSELSSSLP